MAKKETKWESHECASPGKEELKSRWTGGAKKRSLAHETNIFYMLKNK
jgi:hypothetical protein